MTTRDELVKAQAELQRIKEVVHALSHPRAPIAARVEIERGGNRALAIITYPQGGDEGERRLAELAAGILRSWGVCWLPDGEHEADLERQAALARAALEGALAGRDGWQDAARQALAAEGGRALNNYIGTLRRVLTAAGALALAVRDAGPDGDVAAGLVKLESAVRDVVDIEEGDAEGERA